MNNGVQGIHASGSWRFASIQDSNVPPHGYDWKVDFQFSISSYLELEMSEAKER